MIKLKPLLKRTYKLAYLTLFIAAFFCIGGPVIIYNHKDDSDLGDTKTNMSTNGKLQFLILWIVVLLMKVFSK